MVYFNSNSVSKSKNFLLRVKDFFIQEPVLILEIAFCIIGIIVACLANNRLNELISAETSSKTIVAYEKYSKKLSDLETTQEYKQLCNKLAEYAGCDSAYISTDTARVVTNIDGEFVVTTVATNIYWIVTENSIETDTASSSTEDLSVFYAEYDCSSSAAAPGYICPEKCVQKACRLSKEVEEDLGYTTEEMIKIFNSRFNVESDDCSKFKTVLINE